MGLDLYGVFEKRVSEGWEGLDIIGNFDRNYDLFAWLSWGGDDVGSCQIEPIAYTRGFPSDLNIATDKIYRTTSGKQMLIGTRGCSWLLGSEILAATPPKLIRTVVVTPAAFEYHDDPDYPAWRVAINHFFYRNPGPPAKTFSIEDDVKFDGALLDFDFSECPEIPRKEMKTKRTVYQWMYDFAPEFEPFITQVRSQVALHGEVRFIFGFS